MRDLVSGLRMLRRSPGLAFAAILSIGLGIGATTAIFGVVRHVLLRPLPFADPDRLVALWETSPETPSAGWRRPTSSTGSATRRRSSTAWPPTTASRPRSPADGEPERLRAVSASGTFFARARPTGGGGPHAPARPTTDAGAPCVAVLTHALRQRRFAGPPRRRHVAGPRRPAVRGRRRAARAPSSSRCMLARRVVDQRRSRRAAQLPVPRRHHDRARLAPALRRRPAARTGSRSTAAPSQRCRR